MDEVEKSKEIIKRLHSRLAYWNKDTVFLQVNTASGCKLYIPTRDKADDKLIKEKEAWQDILDISKL